MTRSIRLSGFLGLVLLIGANIGCGKSGPPTATVTGKVTTSLKGVTLKGFRVGFDVKGLGGGTAVIGDDGTYTAEGIPQGEAVVIIVPPLAEPGAKPVVIPPALRKYMGAGTSGLSTPVKAGTNQYDIAIK